MEMDSHWKNGTWELIKSKRENPLSVKWVYCIKTKPNEVMDRFKARLVVKGYEQT